MSIGIPIAMFLCGLSMGVYLGPMINKHEKKITKRIEELEKGLQELEKERNSIKEKEPEDLKSEIVGVITSEE